MGWKGTRAWSLAVCIRHPPLVQDTRPCQVLLPVDATELRCLRLGARYRTFLLLSTSGAPCAHGNTYSRTLLRACLGGL